MLDGNENLGSEFFGKPSACRGANLPRQGAPKNDNNTALPNEKNLC
jgi:hypothetical protein